MPAAGTRRERLKQSVRDYCFGADTWRDRFPVTRWLPEYTPANLVSDTIAGLTVGLTVIPQSLAYASIAKLPLVYGLYSAFMGSFVYCFFGMSRDVAVGPTAIVCLLVANYGMPLAADDPENVDGDLKDARYAVLLAFFCGLSQVVLGTLHLGFVTNYISSVVISGFTSASALTIGVGQVKNILGIKIDGETFTHDVVQIFLRLGETNWPDCLMGAGCILLLWIFRMLKNKSQSTIDKFTPSTPWQHKLMWKIVWILGSARNAVVVVLCAAIAFALVQYDYGGFISITGNVTSGLPPFGLPDFQAPDIFKYLNTGLFVIPLITYLESIAIAKGFGRRAGYKVESNQELIALGLCNFAGSFASSFPVTGSFSRSAINSQSGVATPLGGVFTGSMVLLSLAFFTETFYYIPKAALGAIIVFAVIFMVDYKILKRLWKVRKWEYLPLAATFFLSLHYGIVFGTMIGIGVDVLMLLVPLAKPAHKLENDGVLVIRFKQSLRYPSTDSLLTLLDDRALRADVPRSVILDLQYASNMDFSVAEGLKGAIQGFEKEGKCLALVNVKPGVRRILVKSGFSRLAIFDTVEEATGKIMASDPESGLADRNHHHHRRQTGVAGGAPENAVELRVRKVAGAPRGDSTAPPYAACDPARDAAPAPNHHHPPVRVSDPGRASASDIGSAIEYDPASDDPASDPAPDPASDPSPDGAPDTASGQAPDPASDPAPDRAPDTAPGQAPDPASDPAPDLASDQAPDTASGHQAPAPHHSPAPENPSDPAPDQAVDPSSETTGEVPTTSL